MLEFIICTCLRELHMLLMGNFRNLHHPWQLQTWHALQGFHFCSIFSSCKASGHPAFCRMLNFGGLSKMNGHFSRRIDENCYSILRSMLSPPPIYGNPHNNFWTSFKLKLCKMQHILAVASEMLQLAVV